MRNEGYVENYCSLEVQHQKLCRTLYVQLSAILSVKMDVSGLGLSNCILK